MSKGLFSRFPGELCMTVHQWNVDFPPLLSFLGRQGTDQIPTAGNKGDQGRSEKKKERLTEALGGGAGRDLSVALSAGNKLVRHLSFYFAPF